MNSPNLLSETTDLLAKSSQTVDEIAAEAGVNRHWLGKFRQGKFKNPGVLNVQKLYDYLNDKPRQP